jgi:hypothetical protein
MLASIRCWSCLAGLVAGGALGRPAFAADVAPAADAKTPGKASEAAAAAADVASPEGSGWSVVPFVLPAYQPETSFLIGAAAILGHRPAAGSGLRESAISVVGAASVRGQFSVQVAPDVFVSEDSMHFGGTLSAAHFPDTFYGVGAETSEDDAEPYTADIFEVELSPRWRVLDALYVGPSVRVQSVAVVEVEDGGLLDAGDLIGSEGGQTVQLGVSAFWDTRSSTLYPLRGGIVRLNLRHTLEALGSDYDFDVLRLDGRRYLTLPWHRRHVLALMGLLELRSGEPPLYDLGRLGGGEILRGYYEGRYRDRQYVAAQAEYRLPLFWRVGAVAFASIGGVARDVSAELFTRPRLAAGAGVRVAPVADVPINVRLDVAYGSDINVYFNLGEAF